MPVSAMAQVLAQPLHIEDSGDGSRSGIALASPYECEARIYEWDDSVSKIVLKYQIQLTRRNVTVTEPGHQLHPASALLANDLGVGAEPLVGPLKPGIIVATAPITAIVQNGGASLTPAIRSQNGTVTTSIVNEADETLMLGWTPKYLRADIVGDDNGLLRRRKIEADGAQVWQIA